MDSQPTANEILAQIIDNLLTKSKCATERKQKEYLLKILGNKQLITTLLYSGSIHGWDPKQFHSRSENKSPTISLFQIQDGDCIGGYTEAQWTSSGESVGDSHAMLFNLSQQRQFKNHGTGDEIFCYSDCGPQYGINELAAFEPFNGDGNCQSWANRDSYKIPYEDYKNTLTNKKNGWFTITELEVWEVQYLE